VGVLQSDGTQYQQEGRMNLIDRDELFKWIDRAEEARSIVYMKARLSKCQK